MRPMWRISSLARNLFRKGRVEAELHDEICAYVEMLADEKVRGGASCVEARREALLELDGMEQVKERVREARTGNLLEQTFQDLRFGCRTLARSRGFTAVAALSLALGIGGNAAMFSLVYTVLIRPLPYPQPDRLVRVTGYYPKGAVAAFDEQSRTLRVAGFTAGSEFNLTGQGEALRLRGSSVSASLFSVLGTRADIGRVFESGEDRPGRDRIAILSHSLWRSKFGADSGVAGRLIMIDGVERQVVGVMPPGFGFPSASVQLWLPIKLDPTNWEDYWGSGFMPLVARLRPGATLEGAQNELRPLIAHIITLFPFLMAREWNADAAVVPLQREMVGDVRAKLLLLLSGVVFVLLIACTNVASLLVSRSLARRKEIALRAALGASRGRIVRQLLAESVAVGLAGGAAGLALAGAALNGLKAALPADTPRLIEAGLDWRLFAFAGGLAILTGLGFGLVPALHASRLDLAQVIRGSGQRSTGVTGVRLRSFLVAGEVALSVVLLTSAGLLIASLWHLSNVDPGFRPERIVAIRVSPNESWCQQRSACIAFYDEVLRRARGISGVAGVALVNGVPLSGETPAVPAELEGHPVIPGQNLAPMLWAGAVTPEYFRMMRIPILSGREFTPADQEKSARVVIVSAATARRYWPGENPIGKHIRAIFQDDWRTVAGVAGDVLQYDLGGRTPDYLRGAVYMPYSQSVGNNRKLPATMTLLLKTQMEPSRAADEARRLVSSLNPNVPVSEPRSLEAVVTASTSPSRSMMWLFVSFGGLAVALAVIGAYGVVSYSSAQRTYEMGVRMALGATRTSVFSMVLRQSLALVLTGLALGLVASIALNRAWTRFLYGVTTTDPTTLAAVSLIMILVALVAGFLPARRAAATNPLVTLRVD